MSYKKRMTIDLLPPHEHQEGYVDDCLAGIFAFLGQFTVKESGENPYCEDLCSVVRVLHEAQARVAELEMAATALVNKLHHVHDSASYKGVWTIAQLHNGAYQGPNYADELDALEETLAWFAAHPDAEEGTHYDGL